MLAGLVAFAAGCDQGPYADRSNGEGPPIEVLDGPTLVSTTTTPPTTQIQIAFDRLLMPDSPTRQAFVLADGSGNSLGTSTIAYDPYTRVVTIVPPSVLPAGQNYRLTIASPSGPKDPNGLRAIDGAAIDPKFAQPFIITVPATIPPGPTPAVVDYCTDLYPSVFTHCAGSDCHFTPPPAAGLLLDNGVDLQATAMDRVAIGSNTGPSLGSENQPIVTTFGIDIPIIDQSRADPGNSWLMYKLLLAAPSRPSTGSNYGVAWQPMTDDERARLANLVPGREMPFPFIPTQGPDNNAQALSGDNYEELSLWIAQGAKLGNCSP